MISEFRWSSPAGRLLVRLDGGALATIARLDPGPERGPEDALGERVIAQLRAWFNDPRFAFDLPLTPAPTRFQQRLRAALLAIPVGDVITYGDLARELGSSPRAVGAACGANRVPIVVPCHRVVAANGLGGYGGSHAGADDVAFKRWLVEHEHRATR